MNLTGLLAMVELGSNPASHFIPGDGLSLTGIQLLNAPSYFLVPGGKVVVFVRHA